MMTPRAIKTAHLEPTAEAMKRRALQILITVSLLAPRGPAGAENFKPAPAPAPATPEAPAPAVPAPTAGVQPGGDARPPGVSAPSAADRLLELLGGFRFGSYGRIGYSGDLQEGSMGRSVNVVSHGPRLEEPPYVELDFGYHLRRDTGPSFRVAFTLAFLEDFFHYNGEFDARVAMRNLYLQADNVFTEHLSVWVGSRMYRGDDIYLLDLWPLDNLNTLGGGVMLRFGHTRVNLHAGVNRLTDSFQYQTLSVPNPRIGVDQVVVLDRQRTIVSLKATHEFPKLVGQLGLKASLYGEVHHLPSGTAYDDSKRTTPLPWDMGWVVGAQVGLWGFGKNSHLNLWVRGAGGLGAYGEMAIPFGLDSDKRSLDARELLVALSANYERGVFGLMLGGYLRYFQDADGVASDPDDRWEYVLVARPHLFLHRHFHQVFELSWQGRRPDGLDPSLQIQQIPNVLKFSVIPTLSWGRGTYTRPVLRVVYTLSYLDRAAQFFFPLEDPRREVAVHHFLGAQVEWWFNSSYR